MILGLVAAKQHSNRMPWKNRMVMPDGERLYRHAVYPLIRAVDISRVAVVTNDPVISADVPTVWDEAVTVVRYPVHAIDQRCAPLLTVWRYAVEAIDPPDLECVVCIMANTLGHAVEDVEAVITRMRTGHYWEARSFSDTGEETGLFAFAPHVLLQQPAISSHIGAVRSQAYEIHRRDEVA